MTKKLGLPIEYKKLPQYFDAHNIGEDTEAKNAVLEKLLKKHKVASVLDLTCGTGSQVFFLTKRGYQVVGSDFSPALLKIARDKAKKEKLKIFLFLQISQENVSTSAETNMLSSCTGTWRW